ncbi:MAG: hypothetical protein HY659_08035 [Rhizobiales bacterium]|nr:hypothetical protein [Hyphomicrobiales bacterium]
METPTDRSELHSEHTYSYRPSLLGAPCEFRLTPTALVWQAGRLDGRIAYRDIQAVRLSFQPATMQNYRFMTQIASRTAPKLKIFSTSWKSMLEQSRQDDGYSGFIAELHRRLAAAGSKAIFAGGTNPFIYWPSVAVFAVMTIGFALLTVRALQVGAWGGAAFVGGFFALFLWEIGGFLRRNRPRIYRPDALPPELLPR